MNTKNSALFCLVLILAGCGSLPFRPTPAYVSIYQSPSLSLWYTAVDDCAQQKNITLLNLATPQNAEVAFYFGTPPENSNSVYQVGVEDLAVISNSPAAKTLSLQDIVKRFTQSPEIDLQVWVFPKTDDIQKAFSTNFLQGKTVANNANIALNNRSMIQALIANPSSIGILPQPLVAANLNILTSIKKLPILAVTKTDPNGAAAVLLQCMQEENQ